MLHQPEFVPLSQVAKDLGLPRGWLLRQITGRHIPYLLIGGNVFLHHETVVECIVAMMKRNASEDHGLTLLEDELDPSAGPVGVRRAVAYHSPRMNGKQSW